MKTTQLLLGKERNEEGTIQHYQIMQDGELKVDSNGFEPSDEQTYSLQLVFIGQGLGERLREISATGYEVVNGKRYDSETETFVKLDEFSSLEIMALTQQIKITGGLLMPKVT